MSNMMRMLVYFHICCWLLVACCWFCFLLLRRICIFGKMFRDFFPGAFLFYFFFISHLFKMIFIFKIDKKPHCIFFPDFYLSNLRRIIYTVSKQIVEIFIQQRFII